VLVSTFDDNDPAALNRLEDLLDAYCDARLAPRTAVLARIRANVLAEAAALSTTGAAENRLRLVETAPKPARPAFGTRFARTAFALGFGAMLSLGTSFAVLAAPPGSAFYNARLFIETATLPSQAEARFQGHEKLLEERLDESEVAAASGNTFALAAALEAYQAEVDAASAEAGIDPDRLAHLQATLAKHAAVLTALAVRLPEQASIEDAIEASSKAITRLEAKTHPAHPAHEPQGGGGQGGSGQGGSGQDGQGDGSSDEGEHGSTGGEQP
jgi:Domain of unknown function (DUF5667)